MSILYVTVFGGRPVRKTAPIGSRAVRVWFWGEEESFQDIPRRAWDLGVKQVETASPSWTVKRLLTARQ